MSDQLIEKAMTVARAAHAGQLYSKGGEPKPFFEGHVLPVADLVAEWGYGERVVAAALLHDTLEDAGLTADELRQKGIPEDVIETVRALTWDKKREPQAVYLGRVCTSPLAIVIKYADTTQNIRATEAARNALQPEEYEQLRARYQHNLDALLPLLPDEKAA